MTIGIAIPATKNYITYLEDLLYNISLQTVIPDVISIAISEVKDYKPKEEYNLNLIITCNEEKINGARNRNIAASKLNTDLISFFDCDDIMHPKRTEFILKSFQSNQEISAIVHDFHISKESSFKQYKYSESGFINSEELDIDLHIGVINNINKRHLYPTDELDEFVYHNAHVTVKKNILDYINYNEIHPFPDSIFNRDMVQNGINISALKNKLSYYRIK